MTPSSMHPYPTMPLPEVRLLMDWCHNMAVYHRAHGRDDAADRYARRSQLALARAIELEITS